MRSQYNKAAERLWEKLEFRKDSLDATVVDTKQPFLFGQLAKANPEVEKYVLEVGEEFNYTLSEHQCFWAVCMLIKADMSSYNNEHGTHLIPRK